jgi:hypothetical protein
MGNSALKVWLLLSSVLLCACASGASPSHGNRESPTATNWDMYKAGGRSTIQCQGLGIARLCGSMPSTTYMYFDCSNEQFECLFNSRDVLAIPRAGLSPGQTYSVFGATLKVERCFEARSGCQIFMISSTCSSDSDCECGPVKRRTIIYYTPDRGVIAFYTVSDDPALSEMNVDAATLRDAIPILTFVLVAPEGFLKMPTALEKLAQNPTCQAPGKDSTS